MLPTVGCSTDDGHLLYFSLGLKPTLRPPPLFWTVLTVFMTQQQIQETVIIYEIGYKIFEI